jgi:predicted permease
MDTLWQDIRFGFRMLAQKPAFTVIALLTLALGIGANTAIFSVVNAVLLNPLPYPQSERIMEVCTKGTSFDCSSVSFPNFLDWQRDNQDFQAVAAYRADDFNLTGQAEAERLRGEMVSADFFPILGIKPALGRVFSGDDDHIGAAPVALISDGFWRRKFGASPDIVGKTMTLNGVNYSIIGVAPPGFLFGRSRDVWVPIGQWNNPTFQDRRAALGMRVIGRLKPGVTLTQVSADMDGIGRELAASYPQADAGSSVTVRSLKDWIVGDTGRFLYVLLGAVAFVLLIACANVANLLLARAIGRSREFAIRAALGAGRARVIRQLLTESVLLSVAGGALGLLIAAWGTRAVISLLPDALPRSGEIGMDPRVFIFTAAISLVCGILFGLAPALKTSRPDLQETLKEGGRGSSGTRHRVQGVFVTIEVAMALVLLIGAGLMVRSLAHLWSVDPGFNPHNVLTFNVALAPAVAGNATAARNALRDLHDRLGAMSGVEAVSLVAGSLPVSGSDSELPFWREGQPKPASDSAMDVALFYLVEPEYLKSMGIPLERGRFLTVQDAAHAPFAVVVDESLAHKYFPGEDPIGKRLNIDLLGYQAEIVGLVKHVRHWGLDTDANQPIQAQFYLPLDQLPDQFMPLLVNSVTIVMRTHGPPGAMAGAVRQTVTAANKENVVYDVESMDGIVSDSLADRRFSMALLGVFAALALILSSVGIYGVISYVVSERTHEIGIRMALGAQQRDVLRQMLRQGIKMAYPGIAVGLAAAFILTRLMTKMLYGVSAADPLTFVGVAALLSLVALAACYFPARRATRVDPMIALRYE